jgi:midasin
MRRFFLGEILFFVFVFFFFLTTFFSRYDGPLVDAMKRGQMMLLDEIALAEDAVLERLNSVLESGRTLLLAEKV